MGTPNTWSGAVATAATAFTAAFRASAFWSARQTFIPRAANRLAAARPMPLAAPATTAARPEVRAGWVMVVSQG